MVATVPFLLYCSQLHNARFVMDTQQCILLSIAVELIKFCNVCTSSAIPGLIIFYSKSDFTVTLNRRKQSNVHMSSNKGPRYICVIFNKSVHSLNRFSYKSPISNVINIHAVEAEPNTYGQKNGSTYGQI